MITEFQIFEKKWIKKNIPNWFFLVLRLRISDFNTVDEDPTLDSLMRMEFIQLKGISDHYHISESWFDVRELLLIMKGSEVAKINDIEPIEYFNSDSFCKDNFKLWRRLTMNSPNFKTDKKRDITFSSAIRVIIQDLHLCKSTKNKKNDKFKIKAFHDENGVIEYLELIQYEMTNIFDELYHAGQLHINTLDDFTNVMLRELKNYAKDCPQQKRWTTYMNEHYKKLEEYINTKLEFKELRKILNGTFEYMSNVYEDEGEWYVNSKSFKVPRNSILYFKKISEKPLPKGFYGTYGLKQETIDEIVKKYGLEHNYQIKTVDNHVDMMGILKNEYVNSW